MTDPMKTDDATDEPAKKDDFHGKIVDAALNSEERPSEFDDDGGVTVDLFWEIEVLDQDWKNQTTRWITFNTNIRSKYMTQVWHLNQLFDLPEDVFEAGVCSSGEYESADTEGKIEYMLEFLKGKILRFGELNWEETEPEMDYEVEGETKVITPASIAEGVGGEINEMIVAKGVPSDDKIADLGVEEEVDDGEVETVDI